MNDNLRRHEIEDRLIDRYQYACADFNTYKEKWNRLQRTCDHYWDRDCNCGHDEAHRQMREEERIMTVIENALGYIPEVEEIEA